MCNFVRTFRKLFNMARTKTNEIRAEVSPSLQESLKNISKNYGLTMAQYLRMKLRLVVEAEPEHFKKPYKED